MSSENRETKKHYNLLFLLILLAIFCIIWVPAVIFELHFETVFFISLFILIIAAVVVFAHWRLQ